MFDKRMRLGFVIIIEANEYSYHMKFYTHFNYSIILLNFNPWVHKLQQDQRID